MFQPQQRKSKRFELRLPIELVRAGSASIGTVTETRNLSLSGVLFASGAQLSVGEVLEYFVTLPTGRGPSGVRLHYLGTVIRIESGHGAAAQQQAAPQLRMNGSERRHPFNVAATLERYEFVRVS